MGSRGRGASATRRALIDAALTLFADRGFDEVTAADIAAAAGVSERTFFRYFASKDEVIGGDHEAVLGALVAALAARPGGESPLQAAREVALGLAGAIEADVDRWRLAARLAATAPSLAARRLAIQERRAQILAEALAAREGADPSRDLWPDVLARAAMAATSAAVARWLGAGALPGALPPLIGEAFDVLARGGPPPR